MVACSKLKKKDCSVVCEWVINKGCRNKCPRGKRLNLSTDRCKKQKRLKPCPEGKERHPVTNRCRKIVESLKNTIPKKSHTSQKVLSVKKSSEKKLSPVKDITNKSAKSKQSLSVKKLSEKATPVLKEKLQKPCPEGQERHPVTKRCRKIVSSIKQTKSVKSIKSVKAIQDINTDFLENIQLIDSGSYGCVIKPPLFQDDIVIKDIIKYKDITGDDIGKIYKGSREKFNTELVLLKKIEKIDPEGSFTVKLKGALEINGDAVKKHQTLYTCVKNNSKKYYEIILENGGFSLKSKLYQVSYDNFIYYFKVFLLGMIELKNNNLVHCDIKPANVLINKNKLSLIDFGLTREAKKVYHNSSLNILSYKYPFYPPEFYISAIVLNRQHRRPIHELINDAFFDMEFDKYFASKHYTKELIDSYKRGIEKFYDEILRRNYKSFEEIFNAELAYKADVFALAYVLKALNSNMIYDNDIQKDFVNHLYLRCVEPNPYDRISINELYDLVRNEYYKNKKTSGGFSSYKKHYSIDNGSIPDAENIFN